MTLSYDKRFHDGASEVVADMSMDIINVLLVEKVRLVAEVVGAALEGEPDLSVVGICAEPEEVYQYAEQGKCNLMLVSTSLPDQGALEIVQEVHNTWPEIKVLVMGLVDVESVILHYIEEGASGYILREDGVADLLHNIRAAFDDEALVSPTIAGRLIARLAELSDRLSEIDVDPTDLNELTPREAEILELIAKGKSNRAIANELTIEVGTVKNHVHNILSKLNVNSRKDAAHYAALVDDDIPMSKEE